MSQSKFLEFLIIILLKTSPEKKTRKIDKSNFPVPIFFQKKIMKMKNDGLVLNYSYYWSIFDRIESWYSYDLLDEKSVYVK